MLHLTCLLIELIFEFRGCRLVTNLPPGRRRRDIPRRRWAGNLHKDPGESSSLDRRHKASDSGIDWHQITAFPWDEAPRYLIHDRDRIFRAIVTRRLRAMGIRDKPIASASPWQSGFAERLIGSIRRECIDHLIVLGVLRAHIHPHSKN
jgi:hypothetical protein